MSSAFFHSSSGGQSERADKHNMVARKRRCKQNAEIDELGDYLPYRGTGEKALDKLSILRLTIAGLRLRQFTSQAFRKNGGESEVKKGNIQTHLMNEAMDGFLMVIDSDGVILYASDNMESFVALSPRDVIGHSLHDLVQSEQDSDIIRKNLQPEGSETSQPRKFYLQLKNSLSHKTYQSKNSTKLQMSGNLKISIDNSSIATAGKTLEEEAQPHVLGLVLECRPMAGSKNTTFTTIIGMDMIIQDVDPRMSDVLGFDAQDIIGSSLGDYLHPLDHWRLNLCCDAPLEDADKALSSPYRLMTMTGDWVWVKSKVSVRYDEESNQPLCLEITFDSLSGDEDMLHCLEHRKMEGAGHTEVVRRERSHVQMEPVQYPSLHHVLDEQFQMIPPLLPIPHLMKQLPPPPPPPLPSPPLIPSPSEEAQRQLQDQIQRQRKLLQDLAVQQELYQMQIPGQDPNHVSLDQQPAVNQSSLCSSFSHGSHYPLSPLSCSTNPTQLWFGSFHPHPPPLTNCGQNRPIQTKIGTKNISFVSSVNILSHDTENHFPSVFHKQELCNAYM